MGLFDKFKKKTEEALSPRQQYGKYSLLLLNPKTRNDGYKKIEELETSGFCEAGVVLGQWYQGTNTALAKKHFQIAANAGIAEGFWGLAGNIQHAHIPNLNNDNDAEWVRCCVEAAKGGCADAMNEAGNIYNRLGDFPQSMFWYEMAECYDFPEGEKGVHGIAQKWVAAGRPESCSSEFNKIHHDTAIEFLRMEVDTDKKSIMDRLQRLALDDNGGPAALFLGRSFEYAGFIEEALTWYRVAFNNNEPYGTKCYADMFAAGNGTARDMQKAFNLYNEAAEAGEKTSMFVMGEYYRSTGDIYTAAYWYDMAFIRGFENAIVRLQQLSSSVK